MIATIKRCYDSDTGGCDEANGGAITITRVPPTSTGPTGLTFVVNPLGVSYPLRETISILEDDWDRPVLLTGRAENTDTIATGRDDITYEWLTNYRITEQILLAR